MKGKQVSVTMKDGKVFIGILDCWISALDNEPDPESIILKTTVYPLMDLYVKDILFIQLIPKNIKAKTNLNGMLSSNKNLTAEEAVSYIDAVETEKDLATFLPMWITKHGALKTMNTIMKKEQSHIKRLVRKLISGLLLLLS